MTPPSPPRPVCFMVMPFGRRPVTGIKGAPGKVDFDRLWDKAFKPALEGIGYVAVRADEDLGARILVDMIDHLTLADLVVADITSANANVYYEVGIRHAARRTGCVLLSADWSRPLFDLSTIRSERYPLPKKPSKSDYERIRKLLVRRVPELAEAVTPPHCQDDFPNADPARSQSFAKFARELAAFQARIDAVREARDAPDRTSRAMALAAVFRGETPPPSGLLTKSLALEIVYLLRDCAGWNDVTGFIEQLPDHIHHFAPVEEQYWLARSKSGDHAEAIAALKKLIDFDGASPERCGLIGGRYKKLMGEATSDEARRRYLEQAIEHYERGAALDLNEYYCACNLPRLLRARSGPGDADRAVSLGHLVVAACERARALGTADEWLEPTLLGAAFDAGDATKARELADEIRVGGIDGWKLGVTLSDLRRSLDQAATHARPVLEAVLDDLEILRDDGSGGGGGPVD